MQELAPAPETLTNEQIVAQFPEQINELLKACIDPQYEFERVIQVNKARRNWQFYKGNHYIVPGMVNTPYGEVADYVLIDSPSVGDETGADVKFSNPINVVGGDGYKYVAVMGDSAPRVKGVADDPNDPASEQAGKLADANIRDLWNRIHADRLNRTKAFHQYCTGPCYGRAVWVVDGRKYGVASEPKIVLGQGPDGTPLPQQEGMQEYSNGDAELHLFSVLEVSHPYMAKELENCGWLTCETMQSKWELLKQFKGDEQNPGPLWKYRNDDPPDDDFTAASNSAAEARESVSTPSGLGRQKRPDQWRWRETWVDPFMYEATKDSAFKKIIQSQFKDGFYAGRVGSVPVKVDNLRRTDEWSVCRTARGDKIVEDPIINDSIPLQRCINDLYNMAIETVLRAIAQTIVDSQILDREAMAKKEAVPAEIILTALPVDGDLNKRIYQIPPARVSDQLVPLLQSIRAVMQDITGIRPELSGGGQPTQTYREAKQRKDQALMQLSPQAQELQDSWCKDAENLVKLRAKYGSGTVKVPKKGSFGTQTDVVDMADLKEAGWHAEADDNFPMSTADRFDRMWALLKEFPPEVQQALSILSPLNLEQTLELLQIPGYESAVEDQKRKTLNDIEQLLQSQATSSQPDPQTGVSGAPQPSTPIDPYDDHEFVSKFVPLWFLSDTGRKEKNSNPQGFNNVVAFWQAHVQAATPPQPPPPPPVRASLNVSAKLEDMPPEFAQEMLQGASLPPLPDNATADMVTRQAAEIPPASTSSKDVGDVVPPSSEEQTVQQQQLM